MLRFGQRPGLRPPGAGGILGAPRSEASDGLLGELRWPKGRDAGADPRCGSPALHQPGLRAHEHQRHSDPRAGEPRGGLLALRDEGGPLRGDGAPAAGPLPRRDAREPLAPAATQAHLRADRPLRELRDDLAGADPGLRALGARVAGDLGEAAGSPLRTARRLLEGPLRRLRGAAARSRRSGAPLGDAGLDAGRCAPARRAGARRGPPHAAPGGAAQHGAAGAGRHPEGVAAMPAEAGSALVGPGAGGVPDATAVLARAAGENFPVAPRWLPSGLRRDLLALYGFARLVDQIGDEVVGERKALLDALEAELGLAFEGRARVPLLVELGRTAHARRLPREPFLRLVEANRRDQRVTRAATWAELEDYCRLSANPVGELVLALFGVVTPERIAWSDAICTALQLVEHCQDVREDVGRGRIYLPADERAAFGVREEDLHAAPAPEPLRRLLAFEAERARSLLRAGEPLLATLPPLARICVAGYAAGGHAALDALERGGFDATSRTLAPRRRDTLRHALRLLARSLRRGGRR